MAWGAGRRALLAAAIIVAAVGGARAEHADSGGPLVGHTIIMADGFGGVAIEYMAAKGKAHFWYRGEAKPIKGYWRVDPGGAVCFSYPDYTFDYAPNIKPGEWFCLSRPLYFERVIAKRPGDVFGLTRGVAPFTLSKGQYFGSFEAIQRAVGMRR
ncbi:MAG: hypothetical protein MRY74_02030 [Neomegalonema sp.]|nr:hypothetical protein [Neomegalonema sp.]